MGPAGIAIFFGRFAIRVVALLRLAGFIVPLVVLNACGGPSAGPTGATMTQMTQMSADQIEMVDVDRPVIDQLAKVKSPTLSAKFGDYRRAPKLTIGPGDGVVVSLYQMGSTGLFASTSPQVGIGGSDTGARGTASRPGKYLIRYAGNELPRKIFYTLRDETGRVHDYTKPKLF